MTCVTTALLINYVFVLTLNYFPGFFVRKIKNTIRKLDEPNLTLDILTLEKM